MANELLISCCQSILGIVDELFLMTFVFSSLDYYAILNHSQNYFFYLGAMEELRKEWECEFLFL